MVYYNNGQILEKIPKALFVKMGSKDFIINTKQIEMNERSRVIDSSLEL